MQDYFSFSNSLKTLSPDSKNDKPKIKTLKSLLAIYRNYQELKKYASHNYFSSNTLTYSNSLENKDFRHGSFIMPKPLPSKTRVFGIFAKKKICIT